jgi:phosphonate transport system permease protein
VAAAAARRFPPGGAVRAGQPGGDGPFLAGFLPLETSPDFLALLGRATVDTLAMATAGIALAVLLAVPLGLVLTRSLSVAAIGPGRGGWVGQLLRARRGLLAVLRGVPELVWALLFVRVFGLGPAAGVLALGITYGGMLGKVYGEILESTDAARPRLLEAGSGRLAALAYGLLPNAARSCCPTPCIAGNARCGLGGDGLRRRRRPRAADGPVDEDAQRRRGGDHPGHLPGAGAGRRRLRLLRRRMA